MLKQLIAFGLSVCVATTGWNVFAAELGARSATNQLIIRLKDDGVRRIQSVQRNDAVPDLRLPDGRELTFVRQFNGNGMVVRLPDDVSLEEAQVIAERLAVDPTVVSAQPDRRVYPALVPNDPFYLPGGPGSGDLGQWHLFEDTAGIRMQEGWDLETGSSSITIAVIDSGIIDHADLDNARLLPGYDFFSDVVLDNDGDPGRDADPSDPGDAVAAGECGAGEPATNSSWHGLGVAGIIAATSNNGQDIAGIDFAARLLPIRVLGKCGGSASDVADAVRWAAGITVDGITNPNPAQVINLSLSGLGACDPRGEEQAAINEAVARGAVIVVSAGNQGTDVSSISPASCARVVTVGAIARDGSIASYVNTGQAVDFSAPGGDDPVPADPQNNPPNGIRTLTNLGTSAPVPSPAGDALVDIQGTSFATAQASAVASLMLAVNSSLSPDTLETLLRLTTRVFPDSSCSTSLCGTGVLDASAALAAASDPASVLGLGINEGGGGGGCMLARSSLRLDPLFVLLLLFAGIRGFLNRMKMSD